jgi:hypothetical protein
MGAAVVEHRRSWTRHSPISQSSFSHKDSVCRIADRGYVIVHGSITFAGRSADELNNNELIRKFYFGL